MCVLDFALGACPRSTVPDLLLAARIEGRTLRGRFRRRGSSRYESGSSLAPTNGDGLPSNGLAS